MYFITFHLYAYFSAKFIHTTFTKSKAGYEQLYQTLCSTKFGHTCEYSMITQLQKCSLFLPSTFTVQVSQN